MQLLLLSLFVGCIATNAVEALRKPRSSTAHISWPSWITLEKEDALEKMRNPTAQEVRDKVADYFDELSPIIHRKYERDYANCVNDAVVSGCNDRSLRDFKLMERHADETLVKKAIDCELSSKRPLFTGECQLAWELEKDAVSDEYSPTGGRTSTPKYPDNRSDRFSTPRYSDRFSTPGYRDTPRYSDRFSTPGYRDTPRYGDRFSTPGYRDTPRYGDRSSTPGYKETLRYGNRFSTPGYRDTPRYGDRLSTPRYRDTPRYGDRSTTPSYRDTTRGDIRELTLKHEGTSSYRDTPRYGMSTPSYRDSTRYGDRLSTATPGYQSRYSTPRYPDSRTSKKYDMPSWMTPSNVRAIENMRNPKAKDVRDRVANYFQQLGVVEHSNFDNQYLGCVAKDLVKACDDPSLKTVRFLARSQNRAMIGKAVDCERSSHSGSIFTGECKKVWELERDAYLE